MYFDISDLFFNNRGYWFQRPLKDMHPYTFQIVDGNGQLILNTLGVSPDDISIEIKPSEEHEYLQILSIFGKTQKLDKEYSVNMQFTIKRKIESVDWESVDGVTVLTIFFEQPVQSSVKINRK